MHYLNHYIELGETEARVNWDQRKQNKSNDILFDVNPKIEFEGKFQITFITYWEY